MEAGRPVRQPAEIQARGMVAGHRVVAEPIGPCCGIAPWGEEKGGPGDDSDFCWCG